jgi:hypothetical protein
MEIHDFDEARETLKKLETRLKRDARDMVKVLREDVPVYFVRTIRKVFERSAHADRLDGAGVKRLKQDTLATSEKLAEEIAEQLAPPEAWSWDLDKALPQDPQDLDEHPRVSEVLGRVGDTLVEVLERHSIPAEELGEDASYRLPTYFVAGHFMKSLVANYWRSLSDYVELSKRLRESDQADQREARRERWDSA